ncbi:MAG: hypothetical protein JO202_04600 [Ktedonobacteraceae bacterium]|nr:hypothetical protein [Ktedonobacteraceae bacterium]
MQFWIGDWLNYGERAWGKKYEEALQQTGLDYQTLRDYKWVASHVPLSVRKDTLSFHHHKQVASLDTQQQEHLLTKAVAFAWSLIKLKQEKYRLLLEQKRVGVHLPDAGFVLGDCTKVLATIPDSSLDLLLTDPPYGIDYESEHREVNPLGKFANDTLEQTLQTLDTALTLAHRKLKENSHVYIFCSWKTDQYMKAIAAKYFQVKNILVWEKNNWTAGDLDANYGQIHEFIVFAQKGRRHLNGRRDSSVLHFDRVPENDRLHPTEKPLPLLEYLIEKSTQVGEVVCDPFAGVASTCLAAKQTGRKYLGIEIETQWYEKGVERLAA